MEVADPSCTDNLVLVQQVRKSMATLGNFHALTILGDVLTTIATSRSFPIKL